MSALFPPAALAATVSIVGQTFTVTYDPALIDPLFGAPTVAVNLIYFVPSRFRALAGNGQNSAAVSATAAQIIITNNHIFRQSLQSIKRYESGSYQVASGGAQNFVGLSGELRAFALNIGGNGADSNGTQTAAALAFVGGTSLNPTGNFVAAPWAAAATIDDSTTTIDGSNAFWLGSAPSIVVTINNVLSANSVGPVADIENFYVSISVNFDGIPATPSGGFSAKPLTVHRRKAH